MDSKEKHKEVRPFEWLTDAPSVVPLVKQAFVCQQKDDLATTPSGRVLHVGSGSSVLGEHLVETLGSTLIEEVVNVDCDEATMQQMKSRWEVQQRVFQEKLRFVTADFSNLDDAAQVIPYPEEYFDVAIDKSTLDCTLCSDSATAGLLCEVYRLLTSEGGTYICISFHHVDLLQPLLEKLPGANWDVSHHVMSRQIEDLIGNKKQLSVGQKPPNESSDNCISSNNNRHKTNTGTSAVRGRAWGESGSFSPDEQYRRTVNVMICRRRHQGGNTSTQLLDKQAVVEHVHQTNDAWFQQHNPMLTSQRRQTIIDLFQKEHPTLNTCDNSETLYSLEVVYKTLFTEEERDHLSYDYYLEDWNAWIAEQNKEETSYPKDKMSVATALKFLNAMQ